GISLVGYVRMAALRLRSRYADRPDRLESGVRRPGRHLVEGGALDPGVAPHRAPAAADPGVDRVVLLRCEAADQHPPAGLPPGRAAPDLQRHRLHSDGDRDGVPPAAEPGGAQADAVLVRTPGTGRRRLSPSWWRWVPA